MGCCSKKGVVQTESDGKDGGAGVSPASTRKCRDCFCCLLFLVFWIGMFVVAAIGIISGDPQRLLYGVDFNGTTCGTGKMKDKSLIFYPRINQDLLEQSKDLTTDPTSLSFYGLCVSECPKETTFICNYDAEEEIQQQFTSESARQKEREKKANKMFGEKECWFVAMPSQNVFFRCIQMTQSNSTSTEICQYPEDSDEYYTTINGKRKPNDKCLVKKVITTSEAVGPAQENPLYTKLQQYTAVIGRCLGDIKKTWVMILIFGAAVALGLGFVFLILLKYFAGCIVWVICWGFILLLLAFALLLSTKGGVIKDSNLQALQATLNDAGLVAAAQNGLTIPENLRADNDRRQVYAIVSYVFFGLTGVSFLLLCFFQKRIRITIGIIKEASRAIQHLPLLILFPIVPFVMILILFIYSAIIGAYIYSTGALNLEQLGTQVGIDTNSTVLMVNKVQPNDLMRILFAYHFFGFLWTNQLINAISMCTIAGAICRYYWSRNKNSDEMGAFPILYCFKNAFRYHFGSLAFGSFIIAVVQFIRAILMYIDHQTKDIQQNNLVIKVAMKIIQCCLWCFEKCLKFLSKNAYIMIAMKGKSFCSSAKDAFKTILFNIAQVSTVSMVTFLLLTAGKIAISMVSAILMFLYLEKNDGKDFGVGSPNEISSPMAPILLTLLLSWFVASTFLGVYEMAIDTILICYCEDKELNKQNGHYFMSDELRKFVASVPITKRIQEQEDS